MCGCEIRHRGGNTPMVVDILCRASTQGGAESQMNTATTLTTDHDRTIIAHKNEAVALQNDLSATLATHQDQTVFAPARDKCLPVNMMLATRCKALGRGTGIGVGDVGEPQYTITAGHEHAVAYENGTEPAAQTLTARADGSPMLDEGEAEDGQ